MKKSLIFALALILVLAFASSAMAAQVLSGNSYISTSETMYTLDGAAPDGSTLSRVYADTKFKADGITNYPYEIYLPNEVNPAAYRIHSSYTKNTDACASCHATHTAVGNYLLQWYSAYETCMACHDGTVSSTYNVLDGRVGADADSAAPGGMFGLGGGSESNHNVTGALDIAAAPGGSTVEDGHGDWEVEFGCESCHSPHGNGGNARLLAPDPNGYATNLAAANGISFGYYAGGTFLDKKDGVAMDPQPTGLLAATKGTISNAVYINGVFENISVQGKTYYIAKPATLRDSLTQAVGPGYTFLKPSRESYFAISVNGIVDWSSTSYGPKNWIIDNSTGVTRAIYTGSGTITGSDVVKFFGIPTVKVAMNIDNYLNDGLTNPTADQMEKVVHGTGMNVFCGACHLDYNTASQEVYDLRNDGKIGGAYKYDTGEYSKAHRHTVGTERTLTDVTKVLDYDFADGINTGAGDKGIFTCLTCHVAHGVSKDYWNRLLVVTGAVGPSGDAWTDAELVELAGSSVLKRMPNMGTCETCHNKEAANDGYFANSNLALVPTEANVPEAGVTDAGQAGAKFVGSAKCEPCHAETYATYRNTAHSKMVTLTTAEDRQRWFDFIATEGFAKTNLNAVTDVAGDYITQLDEVSGHVYKIYKDDLALNVSWDKENTIIGVTYDAGSSYGKLLVLYEDGPITEFEQYGCIQCHNTPKGVATSDWFDYQAKLAAGTIEMGIQCETSGCHGKGSKHVASPSAKNIKNPGALSIQGQSGSASCGECHGSGGHNGEFWKATKPKGYLTAGPNPMYTAQVASCITCHTPHSNEVQDISRNGVAKEDLQLKMEVRALCNSCHENRLVTKADFDKYLPLKANGMPSHLMDGQGYANINTALTEEEGLVDPDNLTKDHRTVE